MKNYAVYLEGADFLLPRGDKKELLGFFVTVRVEAESDLAARVAAQTLVESDPELTGAFREQGIAPKLTVKVVHELLPDNRMSKTPYMYFPMEEP